MTNEKMYITHENIEDLKNRPLTSRQMHELYSDLVDKTEYKSFSEWLYDMLKSGVFELYFLDQFDWDLNTITAVRVINHLFNDLELIPGYHEDIESLLIGYLHTTRLSELDAIKLAKEYCIYRRLSFFKCTI